MLIYQYIYIFFFYIFGHREWKKAILGWHHINLGEASFHPRRVKWCCSQRVTNCCYYTQKTVRLKHPLCASHLPRCSSEMEQLCPHIHSVVTDAAFCTPTLSGRSWNQPGARHTFLHLCHHVSLQTWNCYQPSPDKYPNQFAWRGETAQIKPPIKLKFQKVFFFFHQH